MYSALAFGFTVGFSRPIESSLVDLVLPWEQEVTSSNLVAPIFGRVRPKIEQESRESSKESKTNHRSLSCGLLSTFSSHVWVQGHFGVGDLAACGQK